MKSLRNLLAALALTCALSISAMAGDMGTQVTAPGEMDTQGVATSSTDTGANTTTPGDMGTPVISPTAPVMDIALSLMQSVLSLF